MLIVTNFNCFKSWLKRYSLIFILWIKEILLANFPVSDNYTEPEQLYNTNIFFFISILIQLFGKYLKSTDFVPQIRKTYRYKWQKVYKFIICLSLWGDKEKMEMPGLNLELLYSKYSTTETHSLPLLLVHFLIVSLWLHIKDIHMILHPLLFIIFLGYLIKIYNFKYL